MFNLFRRKQTTDQKQNIQPCAPKQSGESVRTQKPGSALPGGSSADCNKAKRSNNRRKAAPSSAAELIGYDRMYDTGVCDLGGGMYSRTIQFSDINYQAARRDAQVDIFTRYCELLNATDPATHGQITIINDIRNKDRLAEQLLLGATGDSYDIYRKEYNAVLAEKISEGDNSISRSKYFTITTPAASYGAAVQSLSRLEAEAINAFKLLGCDVQPLSGLQRLSLLHDLLRPDDPFRISYEELIYSGLSTKEAVAPMAMDFRQSKSFVFDGHYGSVLYLRDLPTDLSDKLIADITDLPINLSINIHFDRIEQAAAVERVQRKIAMMEAEQTDHQDRAASKGRSLETATPALLRNRYAGAKALLSDLENHNQRMFRATILIYTYADDPATLQEQVKQIRAAAGQNTCTAVPLELRQKEGFNSILPLGRNHVELFRTLTTSSLAIFIPFTTQELSDPDGMYYGLNKISRNMILLSRYHLNSPAGWILGSPGSGKSLAAKQEILSILLSDPEAEVFIIDPEREYLPLARALGGENIRISAGSPHHLNAMDLSDHYSDDDPLLLKSDYVLTLMELLVGGRDGLSAAQRSIISRVTILSYQQYFARGDKSKMPTLRTVYDLLLQQPEPEAKGIALSLELYINGALSVFSKPTNVDITKRFVVYDIRDLGNALRTFGMMVVLDQIWNRVTRNRAIGKRTWIFIDEAQLLFTNPYSAQYCFEIWSRARKWGAIPTGITQNVETLLLSDLSRRMLSNSDYILMLNQSASDRAELAALLNISPRQLTFVSAAQPGHGLLFAGKSILPIANDFPTTSPLYKLITTKFEDIHTDSAPTERLSDCP